MLPNELKSLLRKAILIVSSLLMYFPLIRAQSCISRPPFSAYTFVNPNIIDANTAGALQLIDLEGLEEYYEKKGNLQIRSNVEEWYERYCEIPTKPDIGFLIYQASIEDLEQLRSAIRSPSLRLSIRTSDNSFAQYLHENKCLETVEYLIFAKTCEPYVTRKSAWQSESRAQSVMLDLISQGEKELKRTKSHYIRLRYAYQIIRLAHYSKQYELALELHDKLTPAIKNDPSIIEDWIRGHRAGALMAMGDTVMASYLFSRVFERSPAKRNSAYQSFRIKTDEQWQRCLYLCKNDKEKATLYAIRGSFPDSKLLIEMKNIYAHDPASHYLSLFLLREMRKLEKHLLGVSFNDKRDRNKRYHGIPSREAGSKLVSLQQFVTQVLKEGLVPEPGLWWLADGYLAVLSGNYYDARKSFDKAEQEVGKGILKEQLDVFRLVLQIVAYQKISDEIEEEVGSIMQFNKYYRRYEDFTDFIDDKLTQLYLQNGNPGKAFMMQYPFSYLKPNPKSELIEDLINVCREPERTLLEQNMVAAGDSTILEDLLDLKATYLMSINRHEAALATYKLIKRVDWDNYGIYAPFKARMGECVSCPLPASALPLNKGQILERILELEYSAKAGTVDVGKAYFDIGTALYNMTYFGHSWRAADYFRSGVSLRTEYLKDGDNITPHSRYPYGNVENLDCSQARFYFEKARLATDSVELAAQATFMAAKCERNEYYINRWQPDAVQTFDNFQILVENYYRTEFFQRMMKECLYLNAYANRYYELD